MNQNNIAIQYDETSFGLHPFPFSVAEVNPNSCCLSPDEECLVHQGVIDGKIIHVEANPHVMRQHRICVAGTGKVYSNMTMSPGIAPFLFLMALPSYWLSQFTDREILSKLRNQEGFICDMTPLFDQRLKQRERLAWHASSLNQKLWSLRYHRDNLASAFSPDNNHPVELDILASNAEFSAIDASMYSILDEYASVISLLERISTRKDVTNNFHKLVNNPSQLSEGIRKEFGNLDWYEPFRLRRANSSHSYVAHISLTEEENDFVIYQNPDHRIFSGAFENNMKNVSAIDQYTKELAAFDSFLVSLSISLLGTFHPFDLVTIKNINIGSDEKSDYEYSTVWCREIIFNEAYTHPDEGAIMSDNGELIIKSESTGGVSVLERTIFNN